MGLRSILPSGRGLLLTDVLLAGWIVFWCFMGLRVGTEVRDLGRLSRSVERVGQAVSATGTALERLDGIPVVGKELSEPGAPIREAGEAARATAGQSREAARDLSILLALAIALAPSLPVLLLYLPDRIEVRRDRRTLGREVQAGLSPELAELLARRAAVHLPLHRLRAVTQDVGADLVAGRHADLARAELRRLGVREG